jgi:hypothetical protein
MISNTTNTIGGTAKSWKTKVIMVSRSLRLVFWVEFRPVVGKRFTNGCRKISYIMNPPTIMSVSTISPSNLIEADVPSGPRGRSACNIHSFFFAASAGLQLILFMNFTYVWNTGAYKRGPGGCGRYRKATPDFSCLNASRGLGFTVPLPEVLVSAECIKAFGEGCHPTPRPLFGVPRVFEASREPLSAASLTTHSTFSVNILLGVSRWAVSYTYLNRESSAPVRAPAPEDAGTLAT